MIQGTSELTATNASADAFGPGEKVCTPLSFLIACAHLGPSDCGFAGDDGTPLGSFPQPASAHPNAAEEGGRPHPCG